MTYPVRILRTILYNNRTNDLYFNAVADYGVKDVVYRSYAIKRLIISYTAKTIISMLIIEQKQYYQYKLTPAMWLAKIKNRSMRYIA